MSAVAAYKTTVYIEASVIPSRWEGSVINRIVIRQRLESGRSEVIAEGNISQLDDGDIFTVGKDRWYAYFPESEVAIELPKEGRNFMEWEHILAKEVAQYLEEGGEL